MEEDTNRLCMNCVFWGIQWHPKQGGTWEGYRKTKTQWNPLFLTRHCLNSKFTFVDGTHHRGGAAAFIQHVMTHYGEAGLSGYSDRAYYMGKLPINIFEKPKSWGTHQRESFATGREFGCIHWQEDRPMDLESDS